MTRLSCFTGVRDLGVYHFAWLFSLHQIPIDVVECTNAEEVAVVKTLRSDWRRLEVFPSRTRQDAGWRIVEGQALLESGLGMVNVPQPSASEDQNEQEEV